MPKILIATGIYPPDIGGPATILRALAASLRNQGLAVKVITYADQADKADDVYRILRQGHPLLRQAKYFWRLFGLANWADAIYATDLYSVGYFAYWLKKILGKKYVIRFAGDSAWELAAAKGWTKDYIIDFQDKKYDKKIEKLKNRRKKILAEADKVIAVSRFMALVAKKIGVPENKIEVIYNSVDFAGGLAFDSAKVEAIKNQFGGAKKIIMTACRLAPWKGVDGIIKILPDLIKLAGPVSFLVLGDGRQEADLKKLAKDLAVGGRVFFLGKIKREEIMNYYKAADLFILNSQYEGLSHTLLEAMSAQAPIIASAIGGNPELISDGEQGLLVGYNNRKELLAAAGRILMDNNLAASLARQAKIKSGEFSWEKTAAQTAFVLNQVCYG
ncbi:MAG: hypothetical protein A3J65_04630 [Candidatus Buchananbacteria bacterium RIFCSPHIGHO2_02_FULL_45_11b]|uniref:Glycosyl transferase family 1 domain-containing protein n=1 Tax=Candidatus Buchananbacteria bacterium RIFCSPHIGHO2_02_FULL_45_11b TaxID=1797541 RepID=A0A1G1YFM6_9BACT|nr:MAG: hypothetical protein A3J65_04630 [Candidatus Buchananbacteria bacterium RIFCSPHIGHO2_02_FULL_45_11b]